MAGISLTNVTNWVKVRYIDTPNELRDMLYDGGSSAFWQSLKGNAKMTEGKDWTTPLRGGQKKTSGSDSSVTWTRSKAGATAPRITFKHQLFYDYNYVAIDRPTMLATKTMAGTFAATLKDEINQSLMDMAIDGASGAFVGMSKGSIGQVKAKAAGNKELTLGDGDILHRFQPGQYVEFAAAAYDGSTDNRRAVSTAKSHEIEKVDMDQKKIWLKTAASAIAVGDLIFKEGDYLKISNGTNHLMGNADYCPSNISQSDSFLGANRSIMPQRLAGVRVTATADASVKKGDRIHNYILWTRTKVQRHFPGYRVTKVFANPLVQYHLEVADRYKGAVRYLEEKEKEKYGCMGFDAFWMLGASVHGGKGKSMGKVPIVFDPIVPETQIHLICEPAWEIRYLSEKEGSIISFKMEQGNRLFLDRVGDNISLLQLEAYYFFVNKLPGANAVIDISALDIDAFA